MLHYLLARKRLLALVLAISTFVGLVAAKLNTSSGLQVAVATTHVVVDYPEPSIVQRRALEQHLGGLQKRAEMFGRLMVTEPVLEHVGRRAGLPPDQITGVARITANVPLTLREPGSEVRAAQIRDSQLPYHLELQSSPAEPILSIYAQAPTTDEAERLADASITGVEDYLAELARTERVPRERQARLRQLGDDRGGVINPSAAMFTGALTFMVAFGLTAVALLALVYRHRRRRMPDRPRRPAPEPYDEDDHWPHTTRLVPWLIAGFIVMLWLVPFNKIQLAISTPIDMKLDRLVLPFIVGAWLLAFAAGPKFAPRLRMTWIHVALGTFLAFAFLSVVVNAYDLNQTLEFDLAFKKLPLLVSYLSIFVIVASAVRPGEVRAFMTLTLGLAVITGLGLVYELRFQQNLFSLWTDKLLPGVFQVELADATVVDSQGRRGIVGPAEVGLEAVSMLSFALPIVLVGIVTAGDRRKRILYVLAACALVAGTLATGRKSALVAPASVLLTLAYFRRRELLSLAPVGLAVGAVVTVLSPGMIGGIIAQFTRSDASTVATTSDRTADYDAIRPDLWTHILFGRGYGSYNHDTYRILDSEILMRTVETGALGLAAFLLIGVSVVFAARRTIAARDPLTSPPALIGAAVAVCFIVVSTLYDVLSFPHATYIFLYMAGLTTVVVGRERAAPPPLARAQHPGRPGPTPAPERRPVAAVR
jgi:hypothetical protein